MEKHSIDKNAVDKHTLDKHTLDKHIQTYISQLSDIEKKVLSIAKDHLETSFSIEKSLGFKEWLEKQTNINP